MRGTRSAGWICFLSVAFLAIGVERAEAQLTGACCDYLNEVCADGVTKSSCESSNHQYRGHGTTCDNLSYPCGCDTECSACSVKQGAGSRHVEIKLVSVSSSGGNTTFTYEICQAPSSQDLSHWVMGLSPDCCDRIVSATGGTEIESSCKVDPTTGLFGLKWETDNGVPICSGSTCNGGGALFSITLSGSVPTGCVKTVNKINGPPASAFGCVEGPVCQDCVEHADCDDGNVCNGVELCVSGECQTGTPLDCNDGDPCTIDTCDPVDGCINTPKNCNDGVSCTIDTCDPITGDCVNTPDDSACDDGLFCNGQEWCHPTLGCQAGTPPDCDDGVACTVDVCDYQTVTLNFTTEDDFLTPLVNGQKIDVGEEFGVLVNISSLDPFNSQHRGPAIFNSTPCPGGPNCGGGDPDLLVGLGNLLILQNKSVGTLVGDIFNPPDDEAGGGTLVFDFLVPNVRMASIDLVDIDSHTSATVVLTDGSSMTRTYNVPSRWTRDIDVQGPAGYKTLDLTTLAPQPGEPVSGGPFYATAVEDPGFDPNTVVKVQLTLTGSGGMDNLSFSYGSGECVNTPVDSLCDDGKYCTGVETCDPTLGCQAGTPVDCDDGVACTVDNCDELTQSCVHTPNNALCDDGNPCNGLETCNPTLGCQAGTPPACNDGLACTIDTCDPDTGQCVHTPDDSLCDDGIFCNGEETCSPLHGCVAGDPVECHDGVACTVDVCDEDLEQCVHTPMDSACNDGNPCTINTCDLINGCQTTPVVCDDGIDCTIDSCNPQTGQCVHTPDDSACDDGVFCNGMETCDPTLGCQAGTPIDCDDGIACTVDTCDEATQSCINTPDNSVCDDGVACTVDVCDPMNGCTNTPDDNLCDDGNPCTINTCDATNGCQTTPVVCDDGVDCTVDTCDPQTGQCVYTPDDSFCDDGVFCNGVETCDPSLGCQAGTPVNCDDGVGCTVDTCDEATQSCVNMPDDSLCDDGLFCNGVETCDPFNDCQAGMPIDCDDGIDCTVDTCDEATQSCIHTPNNGACDDGVACTVDICDPNGGCTNTPDDSLCDDGNPCTTNTCDPFGSCQSAPVVCDDGIACTIDTCDPQTGQCVYTPDDSFCDDGIYCNGTETCDPTLGCQAGAPIDCDDGIDCTIDACDEATQSCTHTPDHGACDDGVFCTTDVCDPVLGCVNTPDDSVCDNGLFCDGEESCDPLLDCQDGPAPCTAPLKCDEILDACVDCITDDQCDDGKWCNGVEACVGGVCQPGTPVNCDDGVACTVDTCNEATQSCINTPNDSLCNDGLFCNGVETCDPMLGCQAGTPVVCDDGIDCTIDACDEGTQSCVHTPDNGACDDGVACTIDVCDPNGGCVNTPDDSLCDDGDPCTINTCDPLGGCQTAPVVCDDGVGCTIDSCDPNTGQCVHEPDDSLCDDGLYCNGEETCDPTLDCQAGTPVDCDDGIDCTVDVCDEATQSCIHTADNGACDDDIDCTNDVCNPTTGCEHTPDDSLCDDGLFCNGDETCDVTEDCQPGSNPCPKELLCDEVNQTCVECFLDEDCDDGAFCNGFEVCVGGFCEPGTPPDCDDGIACTDCFCNPQINFCDCVPDDSLCDDGLFCNGVETCDPTLGCVAGTPPGCNDGITCTIDTCDEATQSCIHIPDDSLCDDGDPCTINTCDPASGCQTTPVVCDDGVPCTIDSCDPDTGECVHEPDDSFCDNGLWCDGQEWCDPENGCQPGTPVDCDDGIDCTIDTCDEVNDQCVHQPKNSICDDGIHCNGIETCDPEQGCVAGKPPVCDDGIACTNSFCDEDQAKCVHIPDDDLCDDDVYCNGEEFCDPLFGCRAGTPVVCDDGIDCTSGACDEATQSCVFTPHNSLCQDGQFCNGEEVCDPDLGCQPGDPIVCDDGIVCTVGLCDETLNICRHIPDNSLCDDGDPCTSGLCQNGSGCVYTTQCGACCIFGGGCVDGVNIFDCELLGPSMFMGIGSTCTGSRGEIEDICPDLIPTMSEWGLVILALLLLAGSKVAFGRRRSEMV